MNKRILVVFGMAATAVGLAAAGPVYVYGTEDSAEITVTEKERVINSGSSKYLVFGRDADNNMRVFENTDALLRGKFNSSTMQGELTVGCTYKLDTYGWRAGFFSMYPNITKIKQLSCSAPANK